MLVQQGIGALEPQEWSEAITAMLLGPVGMVVLLLLVVVFQFLIILRMLRNR